MLIISTARHFTAGICFINYFEFVTTCFIYCIFRDPKVTGKDLGVYKALVHCCAVKVLMILHGSDHPKLVIRCGDTIKHLITLEDVKAILLEKHKSKSRWYRKRNVTQKKQSSGNFFSEVFLIFAQKTICLHL